MNQMAAPEIGQADEAVISLAGSPALSLRRLSSQTFDSVCQLPSIPDVEDDVEEAEEIGGTISLLEIFLRRLVPEITSVAKRRMSLSMGLRNVSSSSIATGGGPIASDDPRYFYSSVSQTHHSCHESRMMRPLSSHDCSPCT
jgi:hypothetical protein